MSEAAAYAEQAVLGCLLNGAEPPYLTPEHFHDPVHAELWLELVRRDAKGLPRDPISMREWWQSHPWQELDKEAPYLARLALDAPTEDSVKAYADSVREHSTRRNLASICEALKMQSGAEGADPQAALEAAEKALSELADTGSVRKRMTSAGDAFRAGLKQVGQGASTGWKSLDKAFLGWKRGRYYIIAGRPGMGKSLMGAGCALNVAKRGIPVLFASLEMPAEDLAIRLASAVSGVPYSSIERGELMPGDSDKLHAASDALDRLPFAIAGIPGASVAALRNLTRRHDREVQRTTGKRLGMLVVDYLGLLSGNGRSRYEDVTDISIALKQLSLELEIPVVCLAQLSRRVEERTDKRPMMSDLRDSGGIEQDADAILLLYRDAYYANQEQEPGDPVKAMEWASRRESKVLEVAIAKQRGAGTRTVELYCDPATGQIADMV
jgi:replicative DNA helicase